MSASAPHGQMVRAELEVVTAVLAVRRQKVASDDAAAVEDNAVDVDALVEGAMDEVVASQRKTSGYNSANTSSRLRSTNASPA